MENFKKSLFAVLECQQTKHLHFKIKFGNSTFFLTPFIRSAMWQHGSSLKKNNRSVSADLAARLEIHATDSLHFVVAFRSV